MTLKSQANWQQAFIENNLLAIGYNAWAGYLAGEKNALNELRNCLQRWGGILPSPLRSLKD